MKIVSFKEIRPTKTNLLNLQKKLDFTVKGEDFLSFKREQLIDQIKHTWPEYQLHRKKLLNVYRRAMLKLFQAYKEMGSRDLKLISNLSRIQRSPKINIRYEKIIGNMVSKIDYVLLEEGRLPAYSFSNTSPYLDDLINEILKDFFENLIRLAETEDMLLKFAYNFNKLNRRINGLKNIIIPNLQLEIKKIKEILEENERENYVRFKKTKDLIYKY